MDAPLCQWCGRALGGLRPAVQAGFVFDREGKQVPIFECRNQRQCGLADKIGAPPVVEDVSTR